MSPISIIVPLYNGSAWISKTLEAALSQTRKAADITVVDDGSTDDGPKIVQQYAGVRLLSNPKKGANNARVFGIQSTASPFIALLDQDDRWTLTHLEKLGAILDEHTQCPAAVGGNTTYTLGQEPDFPEREEHVECFDQWEHYPFHRIPSPSGVLFCREALEQAGGWPTHIEGVADMMTYFRISAKEPIWRTTACTWSRGEHENSYSAKLRAPGFASKYLMRNVQAVQEALALRLQHYPDKVAEHAQALEKFKTIHQVLEAAEGGDATAVAHAARVFDEAYINQPEQIRFYACNGLAWKVAFSGKRQSDGRDTASFLVQHWPASCTVTGKLLLRRLEDIVGRSLVWDYYRGAPLDLYRAKLLAASCCTGLRGMIGRTIPPPIKQRIRQIGR